jgi:GGDEF domain-containing protein
MRRSTFSWAASFALPDAAVVLAAIGFLRPNGLPGWSLPLVQAYAYIVLGAGLVFAWYAARSRILYAMLLLIVSDRALHLVAELQTAQPVISATVFNAIAVLLPLNLLGSALIPSKPIGRIRELGLVILILLQIGFIAWIALSPDQAWAESLKLAFIGPTYTAWTPLPQASLLTFILGGVLLTLAFIRSHNRIDRGSVWALVCCFIALHTFFNGWNPTSFLATAGLILITSLYMERHRELYYDATTRIPSRQALDQALFEPGKVYAIAVVEVDRLKELNLQYGYAVRNDVLQRVAALLSEPSGPAKVFQYTEDMFALVFRDQTLEKVKPHLESLCKRIANTAVPLPERVQPLVKDTSYPSEGSTAKAISITVSIGLAERDDKKPKPQDVLNAAVKMLLRAQKAEGNQIKA